MFIVIIVCGKEVEGDKQWTTKKQSLVETLEKWVNFCEIDGNWVIENYNCI